MAECTRLKNSIAKAITNGITNQIQEDSGMERKMKFLVEISYFRFEFDNYGEAITFMNLAKKSYLEDRKISMTVTYVEEDDEDEV